MATSRLVQHRTPISTLQRGILTRYFDNGLQGVGAEHKENFDKAVAETGLPAKVVRAWIGNNKRLTANDTTKQSSAPSRAPTGTNGYQLFCSEVGSKGLDGATRLKEWKRLWWALKPEDQAEYNRRAAAKKKRKLSELTVEEREQEIVKCTNVLSGTFARLQKLEANGLCVVEKTNSTFGCSSGEGTKVLKDNLNNIEDQFVIASVEKQKAKKKKKSDQERDDLRENFAQKMNGLYTTFTGSDSKFPYGRYNRNEVDFIVQGLPSGIKFRAGSLSSIPELKAIIAADLMIVTKGEQVSPISTEADGSLSEAQSNMASTNPGDENNSGHDTVPIYGSEGELLGFVEQLRTTQEEAQSDGEMMPASELKEKMKAAALVSKKTGNKKKTASKKITKYLERL